MPTAQHHEPRPTIGREIADQTRARRERYEHRRVAATLLPNEAVSKCGRSISSMEPSNSVAVRVSHETRRAFYSCLVTCRSVWHCPNCAKRISSDRRERINHVTQRHTAAGGTAYPATFTLPHDPSCDLKNLRTALSECFTQTISGRQWQKARAEAGLVDFLRCLEVTHGPNGWNPHLHCIFYFDSADAARIDAFGKRLFERWARFVEDRRYGRCNPSIWSFKRANDPAAAVTYITKWGSIPAMEQSSGANRSALSRTPWQILRDIHIRNEPDDRALFTEYAAALKGARHLTGGAILRRLYGEPEGDNEDTAKGQTVLLIDNSGWKYVVRGRLECDVLEAAEKFQDHELLAAVYAVGVPRACVRLPPRSPPEPDSRAVGPVPDRWRNVHPLHNRERKASELVRAFDEAT